MNDGFIWLLLNHMRSFEANGYKLSTTQEQIARTKRNYSKMIYSLFGSMQIIHIYVIQKVIGRNLLPWKKSFSNSSYYHQQNKLQLKEEEKIMIQLNFCGDIIRNHSALYDFYKEKMTNYRISLQQRVLPEAKNKCGSNCQYVRKVLRRFVSKPEAQSLAAIEIIQLK